MKSEIIIKIIGFVATGCTLLSFLMNDMFWLRIINLTACLIWVTYGVVLQKTDWPIIITNVVIGFIHLVWIYRNKIASARPTNQPSKN